MNNLIEVKDYTEYKAALDNQMKESAEGFVRIGYLLKLARDTDILKDSGYANVNDFARAEYGIDKTMVSRFISINDRFSEDGNSPVLKTAYQGFGYAKLVIMLQLPDELNEELTPDYTKREIQILKDEVDEENKISDLEVLAEGENKELTQLEQIVLKICEENIDTYLRLHKAITTDIGIDEENVIELFAPAGEMIYSVRLQGIGRLAVSFKQAEKTVTSINLRTSQKDTYTLYEIVVAVVNTIDTVEDDGKTAWQQLYGRQFPIQEKQEIAPVQHKKISQNKVAKADTKKVSNKSSEKTPETRKMTESGIDNTTEMSTNIKKPVETAEIQNAESIPDAAKDINPDAAKKRDARQIVFESMAAVADEMKNYMLAADENAVRKCLVEINSMLESLKNTDEADVPGQMSFVE